MTREEFVVWYAGLSKGDKLRVMHLIAEERFDASLPDDSAVLYQIRERIRGKFYQEEQK